MNCFCGLKADPGLKLNGKSVCRVCAHNASRMHKVGAFFSNAIAGQGSQGNASGVFEIPCPVTDDKGNVIPFGIYPNIDWS